MSALTDALRHPANRPGPLVRELAALIAPGADLSGLHDSGGVIRDFRPGLEEQAPSLSTGMGRDGATFRRFGADDFAGGALEFTASCLNVSKGEAARWLIERAGLVDTGPTPGQSAPAKPTSARARDLEKAKTSIEKLHPLDEEKGQAALRDWQKIEAGEDSPEAREVARRGLTPALASGLLTAHRFVGVRRKPPRHVLPGALAFEVRGPDGTWWAIKARNPGSKAELKTVKAQRYVYVTAGQSTPAWCGPGQQEAGRDYLIVEGELSAVACVLMLEAAGQGAAWAVQGVASVIAWPHLSYIPAGARVFLYADPDSDGEKARLKWAEVLHAQGALVFQVGGGQASPFAHQDAAGQWQTTADACDALGTVPPGVTPEDHAARCGARLLSALDAAAPWTPEPVREEHPASGAEVQGQAGDVWLSKREGFGLRHGVLCALAMKGENGEERETAEALANFAVYITSQVQTEDGTGDTPLRFEVAGTWATGAPMVPLSDPVVSATEFGGMNWPVRVFGARAIVRNGAGRKDKAREGIQRLSEAAGIDDRTVYAHTGWINHPEHGPLYLTAGAVIGEHGAVSGVEVDLGPDLNAYALPDPAGEAMPGKDGKGEDAGQAVRASLELLALAPDAVGVPVFGAVYRAPLGRSDFAIWATGETGRNKTALMGLAQSHYGAGWNRTRLPEGWQSTANGLEKTAHTVKDMPLVIDDFKPSGSVTDISRAHGNLSRTLQGVADGVGRTRLGIDRQRRAGSAPRGTVMSSSETLPRGHSNRARVVVVPVESKLIHSEAMSKAYYAAEDRAARGVYALAIARYAQWLAAHHDAVMVGSPAHKAMTRALASHFEGAHGRNGPAAAELAYGWATFLTFAVQMGAVSEAEASQTWVRVVSALRDTAQDQGAHLKDEDPVDRALFLLSGLLSQGAVFLEDASGLEAKPPPDDVAHLYGWNSKPWQTDSGEGAEPRTRPGARLLGYYGRSGGDEWGYFLPDALHGELQRAAQAQGAGVLPDASTLYSNMKDRFFTAGMMRCEVEKGGEGRAGRVRPYYKPTARGQRTRVVALRLPIDPEAYSLGTMGTMGTDEGLSTSSTVPSSVPTFNIFIDCLGTMGTPSLDGASLSPSAVPAAGPLEDLSSLSWDELEDVPEGEDLPHAVRL